MLMLRYRQRVENLDFRSIQVNYFNFYKKYNFKNCDFKITFESLRSLSKILVLCNQVLEIMI